MIDQERIVALTGRYPLGALARRPGVSRGVGRAYRRTRTAGAAHRRSSRTRQLPPARAHRTGCSGVRDGWIPWSAPIHARDRACR